MINSITVKNLFGNGKNIDIATPNAINIITGPNGIGKTTILDMISWVCGDLCVVHNKLSHIKFDEICIKFSNGRDIVARPSDNPGVFTFAIRNGNDVLIEKMYNMFDDNLYDRKKIIRLYSGVGDIDTVSVKQDRSDRGIIYSCFGNPFTDEIVAALNEILKENFAYMDVRVDRNQHFFIDDEEVAIGDMPLSILDTVTIIARIMNASHDPTVFLIDTPELYKHICVQERFIDTIMKYMPVGMEVIMVTHSPYIVSEYADLCTKMNIQ